MMSVSTVYRVEDPQGYGLYNSPHGVYKTVWKSSSASSRHPMPGSDHKLVAQPFYQNNVSCWLGWRYTEGTRFAFPNLTALSNWLTLPARRKFAKAGFTIGVYEVPQESAAIGDTQAVFDVNHATLLNRLDLVSFEVPAQLRLDLAA